MEAQPNLQALWGALIVEELVRQGVGLFVVAPGSRSTPLVVAAARHPDVAPQIWVDERGAAFFALGFARGSGRAAAVITTSGTAVANLLPAVVEASLDHVPLILLTADRPPELWDVGANQAIDQPGIFEPYVRWSFDLPCPDERIPARTLLATVDQAVQRATTGDPGPVHLNCPFREPLAPSEAPFDRGCLEGTEAWQRGRAPFNRISVGRRQPEEAHVREAARLMAAARRGLLVTGALSGPEAPQSVAELAAALEWPWITDLRSQLRLGNRAPQHLPHLDRLLAVEPESWRPDVVLQIGGRFTSKRLQRFLDRGQAEHRLLIDPHARRLDPGHRVTWSIQGDVTAWCRVLARAVRGADGAGVPEALSAMHQRIEDAMDAAIADRDALSEPWVARWLTTHMTPDQALFVSSSMPIRDVDDYGAIDGPPLRVDANRGASGIDGVIASSAGFARGCGKACTLLIGDLAVLHDLNALSMLGADVPPLTIVVLNNRGGSIFSFLPVAGYEDVFSPYFDTPHRLRFEGVSRMFGLDYRHVASRSDFESAYRAAIAGGVHAVIEVESDQRANLENHRAIEGAIEAAIRGGSAR